MPRLKLTSFLRVFLVQWKCSLCSTQLVKTYRKIIASDQSWAPTLKTVIRAYNWRYSHPRVCSATEASRSRRDKAVPRRPERAERLTTSLSVNAVPKPARAHGPCSNKEPFFSPPGPGSLCLDHLPRDICQRSAKQEAGNGGVKQRTEALKSLPK